MNVQKQIRELFGIRPGLRAGSWDRFAETWDWQALGFPGVFSTTLFLSVNGHARWSQSNTLLFPTKCCRCDQNATELRDFRPFVNLPLVRLQSPTVHLRGIPHCSNHAGPQPLAFAIVSEQPGRYAQALLVGMYRPFIQDCLALNRRDGEPPPPWVAFPKSHPFGGFNQGTNEYWMRDAWGPFWSALSAEEREDYLTRHDAPPAWRDWSAVRR
jgi:hypothetical protein